MEGAEAGERGPDSDPKTPEKHSGVHADTQGQRRVCRLEFDRLGGKFVR